jgi:small subunit ribosomal protein S16
MGRKKMPIYKIVAADSRSRRDGKFIESVGQYDPNFHPAKVDVNENRALYWLKNGAQPTLTVRNLFSGQGLMLKFHLMRKGADENKRDAELTKWASLQESKHRKLHDKKLKRKEKKRKAKSEQPAAEQPVTGQTA